MTATKFSNTGAIISIVASTLGAGIIAMPAVFNMVGTMYGFLLMGAIGLITFHSIYSLSYAAILTKEKPEEEPSYSGLAGKFSKTLGHIVTMTLIVSVLGAVFAFTQKLVSALVALLMMNETIRTQVVSNEIVLYLVRLAVLLVLCTAYYFLFQLDSLSSLSPFSNLSLVAAIIFSIVMCIYGIYEPVTKAEIKEKDLNVGGAFGLVVFALHCQFGFLGIFNSLKDNSLSNVRFVTLMASIAATALYTAVGFFGFRGLGSNIAGNSTFTIFALLFDSKTDPSADLPSREVLTSLENRYGTILGKYVPEALYFIFIPIFFAGIAFNLFPIKSEVQGLLSKLTGKPISKKGLSLMFCAFVIGSGIKEIKNIDAFLGISGYICTTPLSFLFPSLFVIFTIKKMNFMKMSAIFVALLSAVIMLVLTGIEISIILKN